MRIVITFVTDDVFHNANFQGWQNILQNNIIIAKYTKINNNLIKVWLPCATNLQPQEFFNILKTTFGGDILIYLVILAGHRNEPTNPKWGRINNAITFNNGGEYNNFFQDLQNNIDNYQPIRPIRNDPLIIIFTLEPTKQETEHLYPEWNEAVNSKNGTKYSYSDKKGNIEKITKNNKNNIRIVKFKISDTYTVLFVKENGLEKKNAQGGIDDLLENILSKWKQGLNKEDIYVAVHGLNDYLLDESKFKDKVAYICDFHHSNINPNKEFLDLLNKFLSSLENNHNDIEQICNEITEKIKELSLKPEKSISIFKHRVMSLLSALDIDIQTLIEKNFDDDYWKNLQKIYNGKKIEGIFNDVKKIVYGDDKKSLKSYVANILLQKLNSFSKISEFLPSASEKLTGDEDLNALLIAFQNKNKTLFKNIINLHGNVYHKWLNNLIGAFEELKLEIDDKLNKKV